MIAKGDHKEYVPDSRICQYQANSRGIMLTGDVLSPSVEEDTPLLQKI